MDSTTSQIIKCGGCGCPLHVTSATGFCSAPCEREAAEEASHLAQARYLGADAALTEVGSIVMSEGDARGTLTGDPDGDRFMTLTDWAKCEISEWENDSDASLASHLGVDATTNAMADAWYEGWDLVWADALQAHAIRVLGDIAGALELERDLENRVDALRIKAAHA